MTTPGLVEMKAGAWAAFDRAVRLDDARLADPALSRFGQLAQVVFLEQMAGNLERQSEALERIDDSLQKLARLAALKTGPYALAEGGA